MAIIKFNNRKNSVIDCKNNKLKRGILYITNHKKTSDDLIGGIGVDSNTVCERMETVKQFYGKDGGREYIRFVVSFKGKKDEVIVFMAAENIAALFEDFQVLFAVHINTKNTHAHFIANSVNVNTGKKFSQSRADLQKLKDIINDISNKFGLNLEEMAVDEDDDYLFEYKDYYEEEELIEAMIFMDPPHKESKLIEPMIFYDKP